VRHQDEGMPKALLKVALEFCKQNLNLMHQALLREIKSKSTVNKIIGLMQP
jgi:hypothetical protein